MNMMTVEKMCQKCQKNAKLQVRKQDFITYQNGAFVQNAFPYLSEGDRELFVSGICSSCFDELFGVFDA